ESYKEQTVERKSVSPLAKEKQQIKPKDKIVPNNQPRQVPERKESPQALNNKQNGKAKQPYTATATNRKKKQHPNRLPKQTLQPKDKRIIQITTIPRKRKKQRQKPVRQRHAVRRKR